MNYTRMGVLSALIFAVAVAVGCGGDSGPKPIATTQVVDHFKRATGDLLIRDFLSNETMDRLNLPDADGGSAKYETYGVFTVTVAKGKDVEKEIASILKPSDNGDTSSTVTKEPDGQGIIWERVTYKPGQAPEGAHKTYYVAYKRYGPNLVLTYFPDGKLTDTKWDRLNSILTDLVEAKP